MRKTLLAGGLWVACAAHAQLVQPLFKGGPAEMFTDEDTRIFLAFWAKVLDETPVDQTARWSNPKTGNGGELTPLRSFEWQGSPCKEVRIRNHAQGRKGDEKLVSCKLKGEWKLVSEEQLKK